MDLYRPHLVYTNLIKMAANYRGINLTEGHQLTEEQLAAKMNHTEYTIIRGEKNIKGKLIPHYIILIAPDSKYVGKSQEFLKILKTIRKDPSDDPADILIVADVSIPNNIRNKVDEFTKENPKVDFTACKYDKFLIEAPKHVLVPKHVIADEEEVEAYCARHFTMRDKFPKIMASDTQAIWLGAKPGMVIKIYRLSELAGESIPYRFVIMG